MKSDFNLATFKAISTFVNELAEIFGADNHPLQLYQRLIEKTTVLHEQAILKHVDAFKTFCVKNREAIIHKSLSKLEEKSVKYSDRVFIDFGNIFRKADKDTTSVIWTHLLTISAYVDPTAKTKDILKQTATGKEADFLSDVISRVEEHITPETASNPLLAVSSILSSGVFNDLLTTMNNGMQDGSLDLGKLVGSVQKVVTKLSDSDSSNPSSSPDLSGLINMMSTILPPANNSEQNLHNIMNLVSPSGSSELTNIINNLKISDSVTEIKDEE